MGSRALHARGWTVQIADAHKAKAVGSLAAKTDIKDPRAAELHLDGAVERGYLRENPGRRERRLQTARRGDDPQAP